MQFHITGLQSRAREEMSKHEGFANWDVHFHEGKDYHEVLDKSSLVYLTSESENVLDRLEPEVNYVIGGLVDHNNHKGLCHRLAVEKGIKHARLPLDEHIKLKTRRVLTIDHVFQILAHVSEGKGWKEAFLSVLPSRKGVSEKRAEVESDVVKDEDNDQDGAKEDDGESSNQ